ncbi:hypothetical protein M413DRAFT_433860 [Hebeloma cylindrosporum]|uniref:Uncharacterized protein n=1 Tax=Hebeloma cylindrosporum TaxID=76867 RepID=A0A0C2XA64_HEBCY|nr:hypothetical protein M413DRAFT_433860 [Hebeloma cylindrosporum h7]
MHTGKWWWVTQKTGRTIIPVIISSDKTQLTVFRNKTAYPVYLTIGNIPKHIRRKPSRRAHVLLAYLPTAKLDHITNKAARRRTQANLFHACMGHILKPLEEYGITGLPMTSGDGAVRSGHPIFSNYVGDYPEQVLVTAVKTGECPECPVPPNELGNPESVRSPRELGKILEALDSVSQGPTAFAQACREAGCGMRTLQRPHRRLLQRHLFLSFYIFSTHSSHTLFN